MLDFGIKDLIDILLVAVILYYCYKVMKQSRSVNIFYGVLLFISFWIVVSKVLEMKLLGSILNQLVSVGAIALIILFQEEIRRFFYTIGTHERAHRLLQFFRPGHRHEEEEKLRREREALEKEEEELQKKIKAQASKEEAAMQKAAERRKQTIENQLISVGGSILRRGIMNTLFGKKR